MAIKQNIPPELKIKYMKFTQNKTKYFGEKFTWKITFFKF